MHIKDILSEQKDIQSLDLINIISHTLGITKEGIFINPDRHVTEEEAIRIHEQAGDRKAGKPLAYITKKKEFFSEIFIVDENVLIPRPETEMLVEEALKIVGDVKTPLRIMDMGTGSGIIGILMAKRQTGKVICVDASVEALAVARKNALLHGTYKNMGFVCADLFGGIKRGTKFDMILANLPYVPQEEWDTLQEDVRGFEPRMALDGGKEGMEIYRRFVGALPPFLKDGGHVFCEIGNNLQSHNIKNMLESSGFKVKTHKDLAGSERVVEGSWRSL